IPFFSPEAFDKPSEALQKVLAEAGFTPAEVKVMAARIHDRCPAWSHVRKVNPRGADSTKLRIMFRRGYPFMESSVDNKPRSGLLFVSSQDDIEARFDFIKSQWAGNKNFPAPLRRAFNEPEKTARHMMGRLSPAELLAIAEDPGKRALLGLADK